MNAENNVDYKPGDLVTTLMSGRYGARKFCVGIVVGPSMGVARLQSAGWFSVLCDGEQIVFHCANIRRFDNES